MSVVIITTVTGIMKFNSSNSQDSPRCRSCYPISQMQKLRGSGVHAHEPRPSARSAGSETGVSHWPELGGAECAASSICSPWENQLQVHPPAGLSRLSLFQLTGEQPV